MLCARKWGSKCRFLSRRNLDFFISLLGRGKEWLEEGEGEGSDWKVWGYCKKRKRESVAKLQRPSPFSGRWREGGGKRNRPARIASIRSPWGYILVQQKERGDKIAPRLTVLYYSPLNEFARECRQIAHFSALLKAGKRGRRKVKV